MAGALVLATHERADALGIPQDRRVYPRGWCYARDPVLVAAHPDLARSPAMAAASAEALRIAGVSIDDVAFFDLYSCFASSLHFACDALGLQSRRSPRCSPSPAVCRTTAVPRAGTSPTRSRRWSSGCAREPDATGLVSGVGMHMTKHVFGAYSATPGAVEPPDATRVQADADRKPEVEVVPEHAGDARSARIPWCTVVTASPSGASWCATSRRVPARTRRCARTIFSPTPRRTSWSAAP